MQTKTYALKTILDTFTNYKNNEAKKKLIFDQSPVGGLASKWIILFFIALPFLEYAALFNPYIFNKLGIAQAIIFFIVFLSMVMLLIFTIVVFNNAKVVKKITSSWEEHFPKIDINMVITSGASPYKDFFKHYSDALKSGYSDTALHNALHKAFAQMADENSDLLNAMERDKVNKVE